MSISDNAIDKLLEQYRLTTVKDLVLAMIAPTNDLEPIFVQLQNRINIDQAEGVNLDVIGKLIGRVRPTKCGIGL